jgi:hypothetical protein
LVGLAPMLPPISGGDKWGVASGCPRNQGVRLYTRRMSLRAFVALAALVVFGLVTMLGMFTGNYSWLVLVLAVYVVWMFIRDRSPDRGRRPLGAPDPYRRYRR